MIDRRVINIKQVKMLSKQYVYFRLTMIYFFEKTLRIRIRTYILNDLDPQPSFLFLFLIHSKAIVTFFDILGWERDQRHPLRASYPATD